MTFATGVLFYLVFGMGVAAAVYLSDDDRSWGGRLFRMFAAVIFWPLHLPLLLQPGPRTPPRASAESAAVLPPDSLTRTIEQVELELDAALGSLDGWAEGVFADEQVRLRELRTAWRAQADRVREMDRLLAAPEFIASEVQPAVSAAEAATPADRRLRSERGRRENIARLHALRRRMFDDLLGTLAWVRELVTMIHLAKFSGAPASRAEELVSQIAAAVEGLAEASTWREFDMPPAERERQTHAGESTASAVALESC